MWSSAEVAHRPHKPGVGGSIPSSATNSGDTMIQEEKDPVKEQDQKNEDEEFEYLEKYKKYREDQLKNNLFFDPGY